jgi:osmotically-inducible protein OsmY
MKLRINGLGLALALVAATGLASLCGCAGNRYEQSTGEHIDDKATSMRVKKALGEDGEYKYPGVEVTTFKGTTQLSGFVNTQAQKARAGDLAKNVEGVKNLENNITVKE